MSFVVRSRTFGRRQLIAVQRRFRIDFRMRPLSHCRRYGERSSEGRCFGVGRLNILLCLNDRRCLIGSRAQDITPRCLEVRQLCCNSAWQWSPISCWLINQCQCSVAIAFRNVSYEFPKKFFYIFVIWFYSRNFVVLVFAPSDCLFAQCGNCLGVSELICYMVPGGIAVQYIHFYEFEETLACFFRHSKLELVLYDMNDATRWL